MLSGVTAITTASDTCALMEDGSVRCWGWDQNGEFGMPSRPTSNAVAVPGVTGAVSLSLSGSHACAALSDGRVECWGRLPTPDVIPSPTVPAPAPVTNAQTVIAGENHTCAVLTDGTVQCWGDGQKAALGNGSSRSTDVPDATSAVSVVGLTDPIAIALDWSTSCALRQNGEVECWGELWGTDSTTGPSLYSPLFTPVPKAIDGLTHVRGIALGYDYSCAILQDTTVACWGLVSTYMGGTGTPTVVPVAVPGLTGVVAISAGYENACAVLSDGSIRCWGSNAGLLRYGSSTLFTSSPTPVRVPGINTAIAVAVGSGHSCALLADTTVRCWGLIARECTSDGCSSMSFPLVVRPAP